MNMKKPKKPKRVHGKNYLDQKDRHKAQNLMMEPSTAKIEPHVNRWTPKNPVWATVYVGNDFVRIEELESIDSVAGRVYEIVAKNGVVGGKSCSWHDTFLHLYLEDPNESASFSDKKCTFCLDQYGHVCIRGIGGILTPYSEWREANASLNS